MSLDVYLTVRPRSGTGIFVRQNGQNVEITREEWDAAFPGREPVVVSRDEESDEVYSANITHNLNTMAGKAGIYKHLWRPDEMDPPVTKAAQLIEPLKAGLALLTNDPEYFRQFDASNGWGTYENFVPWVARYLAACIENPDAEVRVSR